MAKKSVEKVGIEEIAKHLSRTENLPSSSAKKLIFALVNFIADATLDKGLSVGLRGFGTFKPSKRASRKVKLQDSDKIVDVPPCVALTFKASAGLKKVVEK